MPDNENRVEVAINNDRYVLKGSESPEYMVSVAAYVDSKMREMQNANPRLSVIQAAILTALNISDELFKMRDEYGSLVELLEEAGNKTKE